MSASEDGGGLVRTTVDLPKDIVERIDNLTEAIGKKDWKRKGQSRMATMREFIDRALPEMEKDCGIVPKSGMPSDVETLDTPDDDEARYDRMFEEAERQRLREAAGVGDE